MLQLMGEDGYLPKYRAIRAQVHCATIIRLGHKQMLARPPRVNFTAVGNCWEEEYHLTVKPLPRHPNVLGTRLKSAIEYCSVLN